MESYYFGTFGHEILDEKSCNEFMRALKRDRSVGVYKTLENNYSRVLSTNIFVKIVSVSYPVPRLFRKDTPGEVIVELSNGAKVNLFKISFYNSNKYMFSISNDVVNAIDKEEIHVPGSEKLKTIGYTVCAYEDNIELKEVMQETNRKRARYLESKRILEQEEKERANEEERKRIEYMNKNEEAGRDVENLFYKK